MLQVIGNRQKQLLRLLLRTKAGVTVDELSAQLHITRSATRQHLAALERDALVEAGATRPSGGRPLQLYKLTEKGKELFPRHYSWFAQLVVEAVRHEHGEAGLRQRLEAMGSAVAGKLVGEHPGSGTRKQKVEQLAKAMDKLGYDARATSAGMKAPVIEADNCVFHELAVGNPEICRFDLAMMGTFTDSEVEHQECMARGGNVCRFKFTAKK